MSISVWTVQTETQGYRQHSNKRLQHLPRDAEVRLPAASLPLSLSFLCGHPPHLLELRPSHPCPVDLTLQQAAFCMDTHLGSDTPGWALLLLPCWTPPPRGLLGSAVPDTFRTIQDRDRKGLKHILKNILHKQVNMGRRSGLQASGKASVLFPIPVWPKLGSGAMGLGHGTAVHCFGGPARIAQWSST